MITTTEAADLTETSPLPPGATRIISGHDAPTVETEDLDARTFADFERYSEQPSWER